MAINETHALSAQVTYEDECIKCIYDAWCEADNLSVRFDETGGKFIASGSVNFSLSVKMKVIVRSILKRRQPLTMILRFQKTVTETIVISNQKLGLKAVHIIFLTDIQQRLKQKLKSAAIYMKHALKLCCAI